ncbi:MAG: MBL fold metallo-hydrolase [Oscillospiraceae bacterium]|nr:MBL fold metallo-hydrolase [Oscillospiraceae bacterium]
MRIVTFASGSSGNCSLVSCGNVNILIDAGISMRRIVKGLAAFGLTPHDICGVLITHEHSDHISGLPMLVKHHGVKAFTVPELVCALEYIEPTLAPNIKCVELNKPFMLGDIEVKAFRTPHDSKYSVGYRLIGDTVFAYATDTGSVTHELVEGLMGAETVLIEANHDLQMLRYGPYPPYLKRRIMSPTGHLSNDDCKKLALLLANSGTKHIILGHLSKENNTPEKAYKAVVGALKGLDVRLSVAPATDFLEVYTGESLCWE